MCVFAIEPGRWLRQVDELRAVVRLASGMEDSGKIGKAAFARGVESLALFASYLQDVGVDEICATATSAVRRAQNGDEFLEAVKRRTGLELEVLSGEEEARVGALAVVNSFALDDMIVLDIGGGSAQLSLVRDRQVQGAESWPLGAVVSTEHYIHSDPPQPDALQELREQVRSSVKRWFKDVPDRAKLPLVGMGGTIRNLANIDLLSGKSEPLEFLHGYSLSGRGLTKVVKRLVTVDAAERAKIDGLSKDRADIIVAGAVVVQEMMKAAGAGELLVSGQGLREGLLYRYLLPNSATHVLADVRAFSITNLRGRMAWRWPPDKDPDHVAHLASRVYEALPHRSADAVWELDLLSAAAKLHDVGRSIDFRDQHKHGFGMIMSEALHGYSRREQSLIGLLVRHQRSGRPGANGLKWLLQDGDQDRLERLTGILRLAINLDRSGTGRITDIECHLVDSTFTVRTVANSPVDARSWIELTAADDAKGLLEEFYGVKVEILPPD